MSNLVATRPSSERLQGRLGPMAIVFMVIAAAAPLTVVAASPIGMALTNGGGVPFNYLAAGLVLLLFAFGYTAMAHHIPDAGAFYSFVGAGLGRRLGTGAAFLAQFTYLSIMTAITAFLGYSASGLLESFGIAGTPWWLWSLLSIGLVGYLGYRNIDLSAKVLAVLLVLEVLVIICLCVAVLLRGGSEAEGITVASFSPEAVLSGSVGLGIMMAFGGYTGFEATAVFRDEARDPRRTIPRATYTAVIVIGVFYTLSTWLIIGAWGVGPVRGIALAHTGDLVQLTATNYVGVWLAEAIGVLLVTSLFACVISFHNVVARYQHSLAREGVLPAGLRAIHPRHGSPSRASLVLSVLSLLLLGIWMVLGWDPLLQVFTWMASVGSLGIIVLFLLTSASVIIFFRRNRLDARLWNTLIAPLLAFVGLAVVGVLAVTNVSVLTGSSRLAVNLALGGSPLVALLIGLAVDVAVAPARTSAAPGPELEAAR